MKNVFTPKNQQKSMVEKGLFENAWQCFYEENKA